MKESEEKAEQVRRDIKADLEEWKDKVDIPNDEDNSKYKEGYKLGFLEALDEYRDRMVHKLHDMYDKGYEEGFIEGRTIGKLDTLHEIHKRLSNGEDIEKIIDDLYGDKV